MLHTQSSTGRYAEETFPFKYDLENLAMFRSHGLPEDSESVQDRRLNDSKRQEGNGEEMGKLLFYEQIKPLLFYFRFSGCFPIQHTTSGWEFKLVSIWFLYSLCVYAGLLVCIFTVIYDVVLQTDSTHTSLSMFNELFIPMLMGYITLPITFWQDSPSIAACLNKWTDFQVLYSKTTKRNLDLKIKKRVNIMAALLPLSSTLTGIIAVYVLKTQFKIWTFLALGFNSMAFMSFISHWMISCFALSIAGESLAQCLKVDLATTTTTTTTNNNHNCVSTLMVKYKTLWLQLSALANLTGNSIYRVYIFGLLISMWFMTLCLYSLPLALKEKDYVSFLIYLNFSTTCTVATYYAHSISYVVPIKIKTPIQNELQKWNTTNLSGEAWSQMMDFLRVTHANAPVISLAGYANIDRKLSQAMIATICTYLIVLLQFRGAQDENSYIANE